MVNVYKKVSTCKLVEEFVDCYGTYNEKSDYTHLDIEDIPFDQREKYAQICINEGNHDSEFIMNSDDLLQRISCIVGNELDYDKKEDLIDSIKSQAIHYYDNQLKEEVTRELSDRNSYNPDAVSQDEEYRIDFNRARMTPQEMRGE